jgi:deoxycytidine triphosphate deaminase
MAKSSPLSEISGYSSLLSHYEKNKDRPWKEWLEFDCTFDKPGKQGLVGLFKSKDDPEKKYIFKISQYINHLAQHESTVMRGLNELSPYCPHFCKTIGNLICQVDPKCRKSGNPFEIMCKYPIEKEVVLCEYIDNSCKFYNYIRSKKVEESVLYSTVKQILLATAIAQTKKQFSHYDLHSNNVMMKKCNKDVVFLYVLDEENQFSVATCGSYPVIIDFGFSYISDMNDGPLWASMAHTDVGFMSDRFDPIADPKLFLVTVSGEIKEKRNSKQSRKLRRIARNLYNPLTIDWESGWDDLDDHGAAHYVTKMVEPYNKYSELFDDFDHYCIDLIQSLIILPIEEQNYSNIHKSFTTFLHEWVKIENEISNPFYNLYILKGLVDAARTVRPDYILQDTKNHAVTEFKRLIYERIKQVTQFCQPKKINFEIMLCSLLVYSKCVEGILYDIISTRMSDKNKEYEKIPLKTAEQVYAAIEASIPDEYVYNENTTVFVFNCINETTEMFKIPEEYLDVVNNTSTLVRGTILYDIHTGKLQI